MNLTLKGLFLKSSETFIFRLIGILSNYIYFYLISFKLGSEEIGVFAFYQALLLFSSIFPQFGLSTSIIKFISDNQFNKKNVILKSLLTITLLSLLTIIIIYFFGDLMFFKNDNFSFSILVIFSLFPFTILNVMPEVFRSLGKMRSFILYKYTLIPIFGLVIIVLSNFSISPIKSYILSIYVVFLILLFHSYKILFSFNEKNNNKDFSIKYLIKVSFPMLLSGSGLIFMSWIDSFMLGIIGSSFSEVGIYNICVKISSSTSIILFSINGIIAPKIAELYNSKKMMELSSIISNSTKLIFMFTLPILIILILFSRNILNFFGSEFQIGIISLIILCIGQLVNAACGSVGYIMQLTGNEKIFKNIILSCLLTNIILNIYLIPVYGMNGAAFSSAICLVSWNIFSMFYIKSKLSLNTYFKFK